MCKNTCINYFYYAKIYNVNLCFNHFNLCLVLGVESRILHMLDKLSITKLYLYSFSNFKLYSLVVLNTFSVVCDHCHYPPEIQMLQNLKHTSAGMKSLV